MLLPGVIRPPLVERLASVAEVASSRVLATAFHFRGMSKHGELTRSLHLPFASRVSMIFFKASCEGPGSIFTG